MSDQSVDNSGQNDRPNSPSRPKIGDSRPAPSVGDTRPNPDSSSSNSGSGDGDGANKKRRRRRGGRGRGGSGGENNGSNNNDNKSNKQSAKGGQSNRNKGNQKKGDGGGNGGRQRKRPQPIEASTSFDTDDHIELDEEALLQRRGKERDGRPVGRYTMCVHVASKATHIAVLEGRQLVEHRVSRPSDDSTQIHGNVYIGRVQNVLPGMEAAFVDIGTPKNAVLYRGDVQFDADDLDDNVNRKAPRIEDILKPRQTIICQVTKNPIAHKGARLTQEVSLPGRFVVLVPNSSTYGISKRLPDAERKRLRQILDGAKPKQHGVIVRTAAENVTAEEIERDVTRLVALWTEIQKLADASKGPTLLYREPEAAMRVIREEFTKDYRGIIVDDPGLFDEVQDYVRSITPALAERVKLYDTSVEKIALFDRHHISEQLRKAVDRKVWLPSGGSLIIESTEALTVIDVNTGKNVGSSNLEETVFRNNLEAAEEIAHQLRLRDVGGIIVIDFVDMEIAKNRDQVISTFRAALARDKTRTQVFEISDLGLVEMTRKRIGEGLVESLSDHCPTCDGRGTILVDDLLMD